MSIFNNFFRKFAAHQGRNNSGDINNFGNYNKASNIKKVNRTAANNATNLHTLNDLFVQTEELLSNIQRTSSYESINVELILLLMDMIYRSAIKSFTTSVHNSFFIELTMNMDYYYIISPILDKWVGLLDTGSKMNKQSLIDFLGDLDEFSLNNPEFIVGSSDNGQDLTIPRFFQIVIWKPFFESAENKANELCRRMRQFLELKNDKIEVLIHSEYALISPFEFEDLVAKLFNQLGYHTEVTPRTGDYGVDVIAKNGKDIIAIQAKKYARGNKVGNRDVQQLLGAMQFRKVKANKAILITTSDFTFQAKEQAKETPIELWDGDYINSMLRKYLKG